MRWLKDFAFPIYFRLLSLLFPLPAASMIYRHTASIDGDERGAADRH